MQNHLDLHAVLWLESYLVKWPKTFIVVSHAREFLNTVVTDILHLHGQKLTAYKGNYDTFERTREEQIKNQVKAFESNERSRAHMQSFIDKFRYNAKRASLVQSRIKALERMGHVDEVFLSGCLYCFAVVGPNGIGKSTILKLIAGELQPSSGTVFRSAKGVPEQKLRAHLGSFGVTGNLALQPMYTLSVEALIQGLVLFQGGILMVSHDEHLISGSVEELWVVSEGKATPFHGTFHDYKKMLQSR
ncbi:hypothetical protein WN943_019285 [Citrus x changshan-huyou]